MNLDSDAIIWSQIDPLFHVKQAFCINWTESISKHIRQTFVDSDETSYWENLDFELEKFKYQSILFTRFHSIETTLVLLLSSLSQKNILQFSRHFTNDRFNRLISAFSSRTIPEELSLSGTSDFGEWFAWKFFGKTNLKSQDVDETKDSCNFIVENSKILLDKSVYNSFKHGLRVGPNSLNVSVDLKGDGIFAPLFDFTDSIGWLELPKEGKGLTFGVAKSDIENDLNSIVIMGMIIEGMKKIRTEKAPVSITLPCGIVSGKALPLISRITFSAK